MKINKKLYSVALVSVALVLFLTVVSPTALADTEQTASSAGAYAYVTNYDDNTVSVIDTVTNTVAATVPVGSYPYGVAVNPAGTKVYVTNDAKNIVSVIDTAKKKVTATVTLGRHPWGIAVNPAGTKVYVANCGSNTVTVIDTATNKVTATVPVGEWPAGVAVNPAGTKLYVANVRSNNLSIIDAATNSVKATVSVGNYPEGVAVTPDGTKIYVANRGSSTVSVIEAATNTVTATLPVGDYPRGVAVNKDGKKVYVANGGSNTVSVIDAAKNKVTATVSVGSSPLGVAVSQDGKKVYVANGDSNTVSVIDTVKNKVTATVSVGSRPIAFGQFIGSSTSTSPIASFSSNVTRGYTPLSVQFIDTSIGATAWSWNFGDGATSDLQSPAHTYSAAGSYTVTLTVANAAGTDTVEESDYITVNPGPDPAIPVADFSASPVSGDKPLKVKFTDTSTGNINSWYWDFGDGVHSTTKNPSHTYTAYGSYNVSLKVMNKSTGANNITIKSQYINVTAPLVADFVTNVTTGSAPLSVQFTDKSTGELTSWKWDFGDGATSTEQNPIHTYSKVGKYTVSLTVTDAVGKDTIEETDYITVKTSPKLVANFSASPTSGNMPLKVTFTDKSTGNPTSWEWTFGDGTRSTSKNAVYTYSKAGTYTAKLTVKDANNATSSKSARITVLKVVKPVVDFSASPTSGKAPLTVAFTDKSKNTPTKWQWTFGDGKTSTEQNPTHKYTKAGTYKVKLIATNSAGSSGVTKYGYIVVS